MTTPFDATQNRYAIVRAITRRARHLFNGASPLGASTSLKHSRIAEDEFRANLLSFTVIPPERRKLFLVKSA